MKNSLVAAALLAFTAFPLSPAHAAPDVVRFHVEQYQIDDNTGDYKQYFSEGVVDGLEINNHFTGTNGQSRAVLFTDPTPTVKVELSGNGKSRGSVSAGITYTLHADIDYAIIVPVIFGGSLSLTTAFSGEPNPSGGLMKTEADIRVTDVLSSNDVRVRNDFEKTDLTQFGYVSETYGADALDLSNAQLQYSSDFCISFNCRGYPLASSQTRTDIDSFSSTFTGLIQLHSNAFGYNAISVELWARLENAGGSWGSYQLSALADPYFYIEPSWAAAHPDVRLVSAAGVGLGNQGPPPSGVPEPESWSLMVLGLGALGAAMRGHRLSKVAA